MMKYLLIFIVGFFSTSSFSGEEAEKYPYDSRHKIVYMEVGGPSLRLGAAFDVRLFKSRVDGLGFRVGIGGSTLEATHIETGLNANLGIITFPMELNYYLGSERTMVILGAGLLPTYLLVSSSGSTLDREKLSEDNNTMSVPASYFMLGLRWQPFVSGITLHAAWNPMYFWDIGYETRSISLGLGFGFK